MNESAAVFIENGIVKHAIEEERFSRIKHSGGIPYKSIDYILTSEKITMEDIDCLSLYWNPFPFTFYRYFIKKLLLST